jgi:hypothetical protein
MKFLARIGRSLDQFFSLDGAPGGTCPDPVGSPAPFLALH